MFYSCKNPENEDLIVSNHSRRVSSLAGWPVLTFTRQQSVIMLARPLL